MRKSNQSAVPLFLSRFEHRFAVWWAKRQLDSVVHPERFSLLRLASFP
jgi:hypothetical protein